MDLKYCYILLFLLLGQSSFGQRVYALYPDKIPNAKEVIDEEEKKYNDVVDSLAFKVSVPTITVFQPRKQADDAAAKSAVIIFPGGGYGTLLTKREGSDIARDLNKLGIVGIVVKYRLPSDRTMYDKGIGPLQDAQQALKQVRERAMEWGIDPAKIGVIGFSAGGHLAATVGTHFEKSYISNENNTNLRPDFMLLINPVISFTDLFGHTGSRTNLIGENPTQAQIDLFSNELHISSKTPPTFLIHADTDVVVKVENSMAFYSGLRKEGVSGELHIYSAGEHGFLTAPSYDEWFGQCVNWMKAMRFINHK